jgi:4-aminobutyrate aminotransferase/(S)-3-amino-2-methylpropionate transaminase
VDEIQTGFGRTGKLFGFEHSGIQPDLVTVAKSLGGGFPISGVVGRAEIMEAPTPGGLGGTFGGNAIACTAALAVLDAFEQDGLVARAATLGSKLSAALDALRVKHADIGVVRGLGFMRAIEFVTDGESKKPDADRAQQVMERARERGLLVIKCGVHRNIVRFLAPIVLSDEDLDEAMRILADALDADKVSAAA